MFTNMLERIHSNAVIVVMSTTHSGENPYQCSYCDKHLNTLERLYYIAAIMAKFTYTLEGIHFDAAVVVMSTNIL